MTRYMTIASTLVAAWLCVARAEEANKPMPSAEELRSSGLVQAGKEEKQLFLIFGSPGCGWCKVFDKYHADEKVSRVLTKHLVIVKVDTAANAGGQEMYDEYGKARGVPAFVILDKDGKTLADSGDEGENIGFPFQPHEIDRYFKALKKACPKLSDAEAEILKDKLMEVRPKKTTTGG